MRLPLDDIARLAGVRFTPVAGWQSRGREFPRAPRCVVVHADASRRTSGPKGALSSVVYGSQTAPPPVANFQIGRDGHVYLVAAGVGNNAGTGNARKLGHPEWDANDDTIGIEAANDNGLVKPAEPWPAVQMEAYRRLVVACHKWMAQQHALALSTQIRFTVGHKEWSTTGKSDPTFNMDTFRAQTRALAVPPPAPKPTPSTGGALMTLSDDEQRELLYTVRSLWRAIGGAGETDPENPKYAVNQRLDRIEDLSEKIAEKVGVATVPPTPGEGS